MTAAVELVARLRARGVILTPDGPTVVVRPARAVRAGEAEAQRRHKQEWLAHLVMAADGIDLVRLTNRYREVIERLWDLAAPDAVVDSVALARLVDEHTKLCDDLGPLWAERCARPWFFAYAHRHGRCPTCGDAGLYHEPDRDGKVVPLPAPVGIRDTTGSLLALPELGPRRTGPYAPCTGCLRGTFVLYGDRALCRD